jgi:ferredoxin--NADP+ reductase/benzoate/toluate 1,2-dioxygenase reductase subunit
MEVSESIKTTTQLHEITEVRHLTDSTFIIRMERNGLQFKTGQHINAGPANSIYTREYSIYSGEKDDYIEILVKEVLDGFISPVLKKKKPGDMLQIEEPGGYFSLPRKLSPQDPLLFIATGTGISPFHSFIRTYPDLNYHLLHGIRNNEEKYDFDFYEPERYKACTSRQKSPFSWFGRVTHYLEEYSPGPGTRCYLCGNNDMIREAYEILIRKGIPMDMIHAEVYF